MGKNIKKAGIIAGAAIGGTIGGALSVIGKVSNKKIIENIGESIIDSTILTGGIAGDLVSGTKDMVAGKVNKNQVQIQIGKEDLLSGGGKVVNNFKDNFHLVTENGVEIAQGIKEGNPRKIKNGVKTLGKVVAVGMITVGAIKISEEEP